MQNGVGHSSGDHVVLLGEIEYFDDAAYAGLGYGPDRYFTRSKELMAEAPDTRRTRTSVLLDDGQQPYLPAQGVLPSADVAELQSPLKAFEQGLAEA